MIQEINLDNNITNNEIVHLNTNSETSTDYSTDYSMDDNQNNNENDIIEEQFLYEIDKSIETGDLYYINNAIDIYKNIIDISFINFANNIKLQIIQETIENNFENMQL